MTISDVIFWSVLTGPLVYLLAIVFSPTPTSARDYHYANRKLSAEEYVDTTLMYAMQVAAVALFATWGYLYGIGSMLVPIFWGLGYWIIAFLIRSGRLDDFIVSNDFGTLHQFIARGGKYKVVSKLAAVLTLLAISGPAMFEAFFMAAVVERASRTNAIFSTTALALLFLAFSAIYMLRGGYSGMVRLDRIQLATGYFGFTLLVSLLLYTLLGRGSDTAIAILAVMLAICAMGIFVARIIHSKRVNRPDPFAFVCTGLAAASTLVVLAVSILSIQSTTPSMNLFNFFFPDSFTWLAILSLFIANGLYQLVDVGQWQRLLSVDPTAVSVEESRRLIAASLVNVAWTSPLTWVIGIVFGMSLKAISLDANAYDATYLIVDHILALASPLNLILIGVLIVSLVGIMFSTIDALISATCFTITSDIFNRRPGDSPKIGFDQLVTLATLVVQLVFYLIVKHLAQDKTDAVLYLCWSFQIGFAPAVVAAIAKWEIKEIFLVLSLIAGALGAAVPLLVFGPDSVYEYSPLFALLGAAVLLALGVNKKSVSSLRV
jgi:hypothetical protein